MGSRCEVGTRMETPHCGSVGRKPLMWACHVFYCFPVEARETSRTGLPFVRVYTCMYLRMYIYRYICMRMCGCGLGEDIWISRVSRVEKKKRGSRIDTAKWMYLPRDWVCVWNNLLMTSSARHINDTN